MNYSFLHTNWAEKAASFILSFSIGDENYDLAHIIDYTLEKLQAFSHCEEIFLLKKEDDNTAHVLYASQKNFENFMLSAKVLEEAWAANKIIIQQPFIAKNYHQDFLQTAKTIITLPIKTGRFEGAIFLAWTILPEFPQSYLDFLNTCHHFNKEVIELTQAKVLTEEFRTRFNIILKNIPQGIVFIDNQGFTGIVNDKSSQWLGIQSGEVEAPILAAAMTKWRNLADNSTAIAERATEIFSNQQVEIHDWLWIFSQPTPLVLQVSCVPTKLNNRTGRLWVFNNITQEYLANEELNKTVVQLDIANTKLTNTIEELDSMNEALRQTNLELSQQKEEILTQSELIRMQNERLTSLNEEKNYLIGVLAHDLRTPVNQVKGLLYLLEEGSETVLTEEQQSYVSMIKEATERLNVMIKQTLDLKAIEAQITSLSLETLNLSELLNKIINSFEKTAITKYITIHKEIEANNFYSYLDKGYTTQIFENLISNALKFSPTHKNLYIRLYQKDSQLITEIEDEGQGVASEEVHKLFGKYQQLSAKPTAGESSTGLGLSIVKKYAVEMKGNVWYEQPEKQGARFVVSFPKI